LCRLDLGVLKRNLIRSSTGFLVNQHFAPINHPAYTRVNIAILEGVVAGFDMRSRWGCDIAYSLTAFCRTYHVGLTFTYQQIRAKKLRAVTLFKPMHIELLGGRIERVLGERLQTVAGLPNGLVNLYYPR